MGDGEERSHHYGDLSVAREVGANADGSHRACRPEGGCSRDGASLGNVNECEAVARPPCGGHQVHEVFGEHRNSVNASDSKIIVKVD